MRCDLRVRWRNWESGFRLNEKLRRGRERARMIDKADDVKVEEKGGLGFG